MKIALDGWLCNPEAEYFMGEVKDILKRKSLACILHASLYEKNEGLMAPL